MCLLGACGEASVRKDISYDERFGAQTTLDVYSPLNSSPRAGVMLVHGGGWREGSKEQLATLARRLAEEGYVAASINYRLGPEGAYPRAVQDTRCAFGFLRAHAAELKVIPERIALIGHSAGGHLVSLLGVDTDTAATVPDCATGNGEKPAAVISSAAPQALVDLSWAPDVQKFMGAPVDNALANYEEASPLEHVGAGEPPFLLIHGNMDVYVPFSHATRMRDALRSAGNDAQLMILRGGGHVLNPGTSTNSLNWEEYGLDSQEAWLAVTDFLRRTIGPSAP